MMKRNVSVILSLLMTLLCAVAFSVALPEAASAAADAPAPLSALTIKGGPAVASGGDGYTYDEATGTLTLTNFTDNTNPITWTDGYVNLVVNGDCSVSSIQGSSSTCGLLSITGTGTLTGNSLYSRSLKVDGPTVVCERSTGSAIYVAGDATVVSGTLRGTGTTSTVGGIDVRGKLTIHGGTVEGYNTVATGISGGTRYAVYVGALNMTGGTLIGQTTNTTYDGAYGIYTKGPIVATGSEGNMPEITAKGGYGIYADSYSAVDRSNISFSHAKVTTQAGSESGNAILGKDITITDSVVDAQGKYTAINATNDLTISGDSVITANANNAVYAHNNITITDAPTISAKAEGARGRGIFASTGSVNVNLTGGSIHAEGKRSTWDDGLLYGGAISAGYKQQAGNSGIILGGKSKLTGGMQVLDLANDSTTNERCSVGKDGEVANVADIKAARTIVPVITGQGSTSPKSFDALPGDSVRFALIPDAGWKVKNAKLNGQNLGAVQEVSFTATGRDMLEVVFEKEPIKDDTTGTIVDGNKPATGWNQNKSDGTWSYTRPNGNKATSWLKIENKWYYFSKAGVMYTGYNQISGKWHEFKSSGAWAGQRKNTGWKKYSKGWSFKANGKWTYGWKEINSNWYFFDSKGYMKTGWHKSGGKWYWLKKSGAMAENEWVKSGRKYYWVNASGVMVTRDTTIDGKVNKFSKSGVWQGVK